VRLAFLVVAGSCFCLAIGQDASQPSASPMLPNAQVYVNDTLHFTIQFPAGWAIKGSSAPNTVVKAVRKNEGNEVALVSVAVYDLAAMAERDGETDVSRGDFASLDLWDSDPQEWARGLQNDCPAAELIVLEARKVTLSGRHAQFNKIQMRIPDGPALTSINHHVMYNGLLYRVTGSATGAGEWFVTNEPILLASSRTFRFVK